MTILPPVTAPRNRWLPLVLIALLTLAVLGVSIISLVSGWLTIFQNLFYFPIILACVSYTKRGFVFSVILACSYFFLMLIFSRDPVVLQGAVIRVLFFVLVAGVISYLSLVRNRAEDALRESEEFNRGLVENMPNLVIVYDHDQKIRYVNPTATAILGYSTEEMVGTDVLTHVVPDQQAEIAAAMRDQFSLGGGKALEIDLVTKGGQRLAVSSRGVPLRFRNQPAVLVLLADISDRKRAEEELQANERRYRLLFENMTTGFALHEMLYDEQGNPVDYRFLDANQAFERLTGLSVASILGRTVLDVLPGTEQRWIETYAKVVQTGTPVLFEEHASTLGKWFETRAFSTAAHQFATIFSDITERKQAEEETRRERAFFDRLVETAPEGIAITNTLGRVTRVNAEFVRMFGYGVDEAVGQDIDDLVAPPGLEDEARGISVSTNQGKTVLLETTRRRKNGSLVDVSIIGAPILIAGKQVANYAIYRDITERKHAEHQLKVAQLQWNQFLEASPDAMWIKDASGRYVAANKTYLLIDPSVSGDVIGKTDVECFSPEKAAVYVADDRVAIEKGVSEGEFTATGVDGKLRYFLTKKVVLRTSDGSVAGTLGMSRDITERKLMEQKLEDMATHDFLTGLPNRVLLLDRFTIAAALARRNKARLAIMSLDLDKFKSINDTLGHDAGDQVLKTIGTRLTRIVRASDTFARVGGDEFISVMMETSHVEDATVMAQKILDSFTEPLSVGGHQLQLSTSIGIAIYPEDAEDLETLTKKSDAAMYYSKSHGGHQFTFYGDGDVRCV
jgi:diguanylate cyclase (GGDEF)-like protein/PAS domain S-box-containing protein